MDKDTILNYVTETPGNTNRAVLKSMLDSLDGGIEMVTLFDDDISTTDYMPGTQYGPASATGFEYLSKTATEGGIVRVTYEGKSDFGIYRIASTESVFALSINLTINDAPVSMFRLSNYSSPNSFTFNLTSLNPNVESEFEAYCQEPHHLKVEWFTV